jgi:hypothetical protein
VGILGRDEAGGQAERKRSRALTAGVPLELVQKVTGHKTTDIVLKHYFQPWREDFRRALQSAMPKLLTNGQKSPKEEMKEILDRLTAKNWKKGRERLVALLGKLQGGVRQACRDSRGTVKMSKL